MKKIAGILLVAVIYVSASYLAGYFGEKNIRQHIALSEKQYQTQGLNLVLHDYQRGVFSSAMSFSIVYPEINLPDVYQGVITLKSLTQIQHGPIYWLGGLGVGLFSSVSTVEIDTGDERADRFTEKLFGDSIGEIVTKGHFDASYHAQWSVPAVEVAEEGKTLSVAASSLSFAGSYRDLNMHVLLNLGAVNASSESGASFAVSPLRVEINTVNVADQVNIADMDMSVAEISYSDGFMVNFSIEQFAVEQRQTLVNNKIDSAIKFSAEKINGPVQLSGFQQTIMVNQVDMAVIPAWTAIADNIQNADEGSSPFVGEDFKHVVNLLLQEGLQLKLAMTAELMGGASQLDLSVDYTPLADGRSIFDIVNSEDYALLAQGNLVFSAAESIVNETPLIFMLEPYLGTHIVQENEQYVLRVKLADGQLTIGTVDMPAAMLLAFLPQTAGQKNLAEPSAEGSGHADSDALIGE